MFKLTTEQQNIIQALSNGERKVLVEAYAGTGKTSTLIEVIKNNPTKRFLILMFNKSVADEFNQKLKKLGIKNATARTGHSLAYQYVVRVKGYDIGYPLKDWSLAKEYNHPKKVCYHVEKTVTNWCKSVNTNTFASVDDLPIDSRNDLNLGDQTKVVKLSNRVINDMRIKNRKITFDFYMKEFLIGLANGTIKVANYDVVALDEAQDTAPVMKQIFDTLPVSQKIAVGDELQSIYAWNGAISAITDWKEEGGWSTLNLSQSFRLSPDVASDVNYLIKGLFLKETSLKGFESPDPKNPTKATLSRTNTMLIKEMIGYVKHGIKWCTTRDPEAIFEMLNDVSGLNAKSINPEKDYQPKIPYMSDVYDSYIERKKKLTDVMAKSYTFLKFCLEALDSNQDREIITAAKLIPQLAEEDLTSYQLLQMTKEYNATSDKDGFVNLSTAHTAKGLEWDYVKVIGFLPFSNLIYEVLQFRIHEMMTMDYADQHDGIDFSPFNTGAIEWMYDWVKDHIDEMFIYGLWEDIIKNPKNRSHEETLNISELYLLYVAVTRAKKAFICVDADSDLWENGINWNEISFNIQKLIEENYDKEKK